MQLNLLDLSGKETTNKVVIEWLDIDSVFPSDDNPRLSLNEEVIEGLVSVLQESGWATISPIAVRKIANGYEVVDGHHRLESAKRANATQVLCTVLEITDEEAVIQRWLLNNQTEFKDIEKCLYFYKHTKKDSKLGLSRAEFAKKLEKTRVTGNTWAKSGEVAEECKVNFTLLTGKTTHLAEIHSVPRHYWQQLTELLIANDWKVKQTEEICKAVREIDIPEHFQQWLNPDKYIKKTISEALSGSIRTPRDIKNWVTTANECYQRLDEERKVTVIIDDKEVIEYRNLKTLFLDKLPSLCTGDKNPSKIKIEGLEKKILDEVDTLDKKHENWLLSKASLEVQKKEQEKKQRELLELKNKYAPVGFNMDFREFDPKPETYDAIITDVPYVVSNGGTTVRSGKEVSVKKNFEDTLVPSDYLMQCHDFLKEGGYFITTCTMHIYNDLLNEAKKLDFEHLQTIIIHWLNAPPLLTADRFKPNYDFLPIFYKKGGKRFVNKEEIDLQEGSVWQFSICSGKERIKNSNGENLHDTQKPLELYKKIIKTFVPVDGLILEPFAGTGTTVVASKQLKRLCHWIELDENFYLETQERIEKELYWFEVK